MTRTAQPVTPPRDSLDLRALRDGARRSIPWEATPVDLSDAQRKTLGSVWLRLMQQEHLAVGAFATMTYELAQSGCDSVVLALVARAGADEVRHADLCKRMAVVFLGNDAVPAAFAGTPRVPRHTGASVRDRALFHMTEMCCLNETFTGVYFSEAIARATDPLARAALESLFEDEVDHGRVGWAHLAAACRDGWGASVLEPVLPAIFTRAVGHLFEPVLRSHGRGDRALEAHGTLTPDAMREVYEDALSEVILPGFASLGVNVDSVRALAREREWVRG